MALKYVKTMKKYKYINGIRHKAVGYDYNGKPTGWIACERTNNNNQSKQ